ncbi:hypothetical protein RO575_15700 [Methylomonas sp. MO1]|uniref:hypothetical protein n=1 Tax=Methylomonas sp. MO1 TaxID=3073619 RepID=UPI0028A4A53D|nr:hypothetical protein [Methylomonas sp. MO1]MDT4291011.1 hypothetical protein [Methylomonas sp. MO1]
MLAGLGLGGGVRYTGGNYGDLSNSQKAPSYTLIDTSVHYELGAATCWQACVTTGERQFRQASSTGIVY